jgi:hypothetical protein
MSYLLLLTTSHYLHLPSTQVQRRLHTPHLASGLGRPTSSSTMESSPSTTDPRAFRFLDLPKELRLMMYEYLLPPRRHEKLVYKIYYSITIIVPGSVPTIQRTCRLLYEEATQFFAAQLLVPRLLIDCTNDRYMTDHLVPCGAMLVLIAYQRRSVPRVEDALHSWSALSTSSPIMSGSCERGCAILSRFLVRAGVYLFPGRSSRYKHGNKLEIAVRNGGDRWYLETHIKTTCGEHDIEMVVYGTESAQNPSSISHNWVPEGGVIDKKTWDRHWRETC